MAGREYSRSSSLHTFRSANVPHACKSLPHNPFADHHPLNLYPTILYKNGGGTAYSQRSSSSKSSHSSYTLPSSVSRKSCICHSYENTRGVGAFFPFWYDSTSPVPTMSGAPAINSSPYPVTSLSPYFLFSKSFSCHTSDTPPGWPHVSLTKFPFSSVAAIVCLLLIVFSGVASGRTPSPRKELPPSSLAKPSASPGRAPMSPATAPSE